MRLKMTLMVNGKQKPLYIYYNSLEEIVNVCVPGDMMSVMDMLSKKQLNSLTKRLRRKICVVGVGS